MSQLISQLPAETAKKLLLLILEPQNATVKPPVTESRLSTVLESIR